MIEQGEVWWTDLPDPDGSAPGFRRPVVIVQGDSLNQSKIATVICVAVTSNLRWSTAPGNVRLGSASSGLSKDSVANVSAIVTIDKAALVERIEKLPRATVRQVLSGIDIVLGKT